MAVLYRDCLSGKLDQNCNPLPSLQSGSLPKLSTASVLLYRILFYPNLVLLLLCSIESFYPIKLYVWWHLAI